MRLVTASRVIPVAVVVVTLVSCAGSSSPSTSSVVGTTEVTRSSKTTIGMDYCKQELACHPADFETNYGGVTCVGCDPSARCNVTHDRLARDPDCGEHYRAFLECMIAIDCSAFTKADDEGGPCEQPSDAVASCLFPD